MNRSDARTGHLDHHLSATLKQIARLAFEMHLEEGQRPLGVIIHEDTHQLEQVLIL
jgi:hypothetical protein